MVGGILAIASLVQDIHMIRAETDSFAAGRIEEAAARARRVVLLRAWMRDRLAQQVPALADSNRRFPRELPLLEAMLALAPEPALEARCRMLRVLTVGRPEALAMLGAEVRFDPEPEQAPGAPGKPDLRWRVVPVGPPTGAGEQPHRLTRLGPGGRVVTVGTGWAGLLGRSWDVSLDGAAAAVARPDERLIERWELASGRSTMVVVSAPPRALALPPSGADERVAWGASTGEGGAAPQVLYVQEGSRVRRLYPPPGAKVAALGCEWDPDGQTLLVRWLERWPHRAGAPQHLVWMTPDGRELMRAVGRLGPHTPPLRWVRGPGPWVGLAASDAAWVWDGRSPRARLLPAIRGAWGWSPDGRLLAGLDVGHVFVALASDVRVRKEFRLERLPPLFVPARDGGVEWDADGLRFVGRSAARETGPWRATQVHVRLAVAGQDP